MKIKLLDNVLEQDDLNINRHYEVIRAKNVRDDMYYIVINDNGKETAVHELLVSKV